MLNPDTHLKERSVSAVASKLVLVVHEHDDDSLGEVVSVCLQHLAGWQVLSLFCTDESLDRSLYQPPNAILLNVMLSRIDAISFRQKRMIQTLKRHPLTQASPILLLTDKATWLPVAQLQAAGIAGAIAKPFDPKTLPAQIAKILCWN